MKALTDRQARILRVIAASLETRGYAPTFREIGDAVGIDTVKNINAIRDHLLALERKGYLVRKPHAQRAITLTHPVMPPPSHEEIATALLLETVLAVCVAQGFDGAAEALPDWLRMRLARREVAA